MSSCQMQVDLMFMMFELTCMLSAEIIYTNSGKFISFCFTCVCVFICIFERHPDELIPNARLNISTGSGSIN